MAKRIEYTAGDFVGTEGLIYIDEVEPIVSPSGARYRKAKFLCTCGEPFEARIMQVRRDHTTSCGCFRRKSAFEASWRGGIRSHYLYGTWANMMGRCFNSENHNYKDYGGRGITVCTQWQDSKVFLEFCDTVLGERPEGHTLDRIDNDGNYEPSNVQWASKKTQANNRRCSK